MNSMEKDDKTKTEETCSTALSGVDMSSSSRNSLSNFQKNVCKPLPFTCTVCNKQFPKRIILQCHERIHIKQNPDQKGKQGLSKASSLKHQKQLQLGNTPYNCEKCGKKFTISKDLKRHKQLMHGGPSHLVANANLEENLKREEKPTESRLSFSLPDKLKIQAKINMDNEERSPCDICGKILHSSSLYHHRKIHSGESSKSRNFKSRKTNFVKNCDICGKSFSSSSLLNQHLKTHSKEFKCDICDSNFSSKFLLRNHMMIHEEKLLDCDICGKRFSEQNLKTHLKVHIAGKKYSCDICGKSFSMSVSLKEHARTHSGENPYECDICGKTFSWSLTLKLHKSTHTEGKRFSCNICAKTFFFSSALNYHAKTHLGDKPYSCHICSKTFFQACTLTKHMQSAHNQDIRDQCMICNKSFRSLNAHLSKVHKRKGLYSCEICSKKFSKPQQLKTHMKTHSS